MMGSWISQQIRRSEEGDPDGIHLQETPEEPAPTEEQGQAAAQPSEGDDLPPLPPVTDDGRWWWDEEAHSWQPMPGTDDSDDVERPDEPPESRGAGAMEPAAEAARSQGEPEVGTLDDRSGEDETVPPPPPGPGIGAAAPPLPRSPEPPRPPEPPDHTGSESVLWTAPTGASNGRAPGEQRRPEPTALQPLDTTFDWDEVVRPRPQDPPRGWRRLLWKASLGLVRLGPSRAELERRELEWRAATPIHGRRTKVIVSASGKGGVGKTSVAGFLGCQFGYVRRDRGIVVDANPDAGNLVRRLHRPESFHTAADLLDNAGKVKRYADLLEYVSPHDTSRVDFLASRMSQGSPSLLGGKEYGQLHEALSGYYNWLIADLGTGLRSDGNRYWLQVCDQAVVVARAQKDVDEVVAFTLDSLAEQRSADWVRRRAVVIINAVHDETLVNVKAVESYFRSRARACIRIPWDPHLDAGGGFDWDQLSKATRYAYLQLAAELGAALGEPDD